MKKKIAKLAIVFVVVLLCYNTAITSSLIILGFEYKNQIKIDSIELYKPLKWKIDSFYLNTRKNISTLYFINIFIVLILFLLVVQKMIQRKLNVENGHNDY